MNTINNGKKYIDNWKCDEEDVLTELEINGDLGIKIKIAQIKSITTNGNEKIRDYAIISSDQFDKDHTIGKSPKAWLQLINALHNANQLDSLLKFLVKAKIINENGLSGYVSKNNGNSNNSKDSVFEVSVLGESQGQFDSLDAYIKENDATVKANGNGTILGNEKNLDNWIKKGIITVKELLKDTDTFTVSKSVETDTFTVSKPDTIPTVNNLELKENYMLLTPKEKTTVLTELGFSRYPKKLENQLRVQAVMDTIKTTTKTTKTTTEKPTNSGL